MERKQITNTAKLLICTWNIGVFVLVWLGYYNSFAFDRYLRLGGAVTCLIYGIIYLFLCRLYKSFRIASMSILETVITQVICFGIADLIMYVECVLIYNRLVNLIPGIAGVCFQFAGSLLIVMSSKNYMIRHLPVQPTVVIYGKSVSTWEVKDFIRRLLEKYSHLFNIEKRICESDLTFQLEEEIQDYSTVVLYEVSHRIRKKVMRCAVAQKKNVYFTPSIEDITLQGCEQKHLLDTPLMKYGYVYENLTEYRGKRLFDIGMSLIMLIVTSPVMFITALLIKLEDGGPVFFKQNRCTKDGQVFEIIKFRSMIVDAEKHGFVPCTQGDSRITRVGKIIRATRIDELPQLINIFKGDMSFVGPRPERIEHVEKYTKELPEFAYRMRVKGGLTGYAQIFGKYNTTAYDKLRLDLIYIENQSFLLDLKLIMLTLKIIFVPESTEGFSQEKSNLIREKQKETVWENGTESKR